MTHKKTKESMHAKLMLLCLLGIPLSTMSSAEQIKKRSWLSKARTRIAKLIPTKENAPFRALSGLYAYMGCLALYKAFQETAQSLSGAADNRCVPARTQFAYWSLGATYAWLASQAYARLLEQEDDDDDYEDYWDSYRDGKSTDSNKDAIQHQKLSKKERLKALGKAGALLGFIWLISPITCELCSIIATQTSQMVLNPALEQLAVPLISIPALIGQCILYARCLGLSYAKLKEFKTGTAVITEDDDDDEDYYV